MLKSPGPYSVDSSAWIIAHKNSPPDIFKSLWQNIFDLIARGELRSSEIVYEELKRGTDDLASLLRTQNGLFEPTSAAIISATSTVLAACPSLTDVGMDRNAADPYVVALAMTIDGTVVCQERSAKSAAARQKIPDACAVVGVRCIGWLDFLRENGWTF